jgi:hypothetical protein
MAEENRFKKYFPALAEDPNSLLNINTPSRATVSTGGLDYQAPSFGLDLTKLAPKFEDVYIGGERPATPQVDLDYLLEMARRKRMMQEAGANVAGRRQELRERGMLGYENATMPMAAAERVMTRLTPEQVAQMATIPQSALKESTVKTMPGIGTAVKFGNGGTAVVGRYGTGIATPRTENQGEAMIEGMPASKYFAKKAGEQGVSNRYATAVPTGVTDKQDPWGVKPRYTGKAIVEGAMNKKKAKA